MSKLNDILGTEASGINTRIEENARRQVKWYASRSIAVEAATTGTWPVGAQISVGPTIWQYDGTSTAISDMPGWVPVGDLRLEHFGAMGDGSNNDLAAERAAHLYANTDARYKPGVTYQNKKYLGMDNINYLTAPGFIQSGTNGRLQSGISTAPSTVENPVQIIKKVSAANQTYSDGWDGGALYASLDRVGGDLFGGSAIWGIATFSGGTGDLVGVHGRCIVKTAADAGGWGLWGYAVDTEAGSRHLIGCELNIVKHGPDAGWSSLPTVSNTSRGLVVAVESSTTNPATIGIYVGGRASENENSRWYTGMLFQKDSIVPNTADASTKSGDGEVIRIQGGSTYANRYGGLRFENGNFQYGISFAEAKFAGDAAILLGDNQRIKFGSYPGTTKYISYDGSSMLNLYAMDLGRNGTRLLTTRRTGWTTPIGELSRATYVTSSVTTEELAKRVAALITDLTTHGLIGA